MAKITIEEARKDLFNRKNQSEQISLKVQIAFQQYIDFSGSVENVRYFLFQLESKSPFLADNLFVII